MIASIILGRKGSVGFPGKNLHLLKGRPIASYPMEAANKASAVDACFLSTDCPDLKKIGLEHNHRVIDRPKHLATSGALAEDSYIHALNHIEETLASRLDYLVLLFCNAIMVTPEMIQKGIDLLDDCKEADSAISVSKYNMFSPLRARKIDESGFVVPFIDTDVVAKASGTELNCDRDSQGDVYFADVSLVVARPQNLRNIETGLLPQKWMGRKILPIINEAGVDIDYDWQLGQLEYWLKKVNGSSL